MRTNRDGAEQKGLVRRPGARLAAAMATAAAILGALAVPPVVAEGSILPGHGAVPLAGSTRHCTTLAPSHGPGYQLAIGLKQDGKTICAHIGEKILVFLSAPAPTGRPWSRITVSPAGILKPAPMTLMLSRGTTGAVFKALKTGAVQLSSQRPACPKAKAGGATCMAIEVWRAGLLVNAK